MMATAEPTTEKTVYEFEHTSNARTRAVAESESEGLEMAAKASGADSDEFELVETYDPAEVPHDDVHVSGHPFKDGDRLEFVAGDVERIGIEMTVHVDGDTVTFSEETSPYGVQTFAVRDDLSKQRADATLARLYQSGWRKKN